MGKIGLKKPDSRGEIGPKSDWQPNFRGCYHANKGPKLVILRLFTSRLRHGHEEGSLVLV